MLAFGPKNSLIPLEKDFARHTNSKKQEDTSMLTGSNGLMDPVSNTTNVSVSSSSNETSANNSISSPEYTFGQFSMDSPHRTDVINTPFLTTTTNTTANNSLMNLKDTAALPMNWKWKNSNNMQFLSGIENESGNDYGSKDGDDKACISIATPQALNEELKNLEQLEKVFSPMSSANNNKFNENIELSPHQHTASPKTNPLDAEPSIYSNLFLDAKLPNNTNVLAGSNDNYYSLDETNSNNNNNNSMQSILEDFVSSEEAFRFMPDTGSDARRYSEVVTSSFPSMTDSRNSISHSIEFWNLNHKNNNNRKPTQQIIPEDATTERRDSTISPTTTANNPDPTFKLLDHNVSQVLNGYSMDFSKDSGISKPRNTSFSSHRISNNGKNTKHQRASLPLIHDIESFANDAVMTNPLSDSASFFSEENDDDAFAKVNYNSLDAAAMSTYDNNVDPFNILKSPTQDQQFIKPSMMLSDNASAAAKLATSGVDNVNTTPAFQRKSYDISMNTSFKLLPTNHIHHAAQHHQQQSTKQASVSPNLRRRKSSSIALSPTISNNNNNGKDAVQPRKRKSIATIDQNSYDKNKPFNCKDCEKAFRRSEHLKRHIRSVHSAERPFACMFCEKKFSRSDNLSQHLKTHKKHGDF
ncbi:hypothetical protein SUVZ_11G1510 [Saccharomyces uvarum]|uniref:C2H2-type domain-containing protein n=1 Tax=Saccharomyces uvarum TaxID=230603 RepID=A0ABN8WKZ5_SACUV|nr:hypothetical protein SUVZ_11G1510 [Saccharomyces uvarum]